MVHCPGPIPSFPAATSYTTSYILCCVLPHIAISLASLFPANGRHACISPTCSSIPDGGSSSTRPPAKVHQLLERRPQLGVDVRREARDHGPRVDDRPGLLKSRRTHRQLSPPDRYPLDGDVVERRAPRKVERGVLHVAQPAGIAEGQVPRRARARRQAVRENLPVTAFRLRDERQVGLPEAQQPGG